MADVSRLLGGRDGSDAATRGGRDGSDAATRGDRTERAQLILITGLTLAVILVAVVLLLNTVIYTENLATRGVDAGGGEAIEFREGTAADVEGLLVRTDWTDSDTDQGTFEEDLDRYASSTGEHRIREGVRASIDPDTATGAYVAQDVDRGLIPSDAYLENEEEEEEEGEAADPGDEWTLVEGATRTRSYVLDVSVTETLANESDVGSDAFRLRVRPDEGDVWSLYVYRLDGGDVILRVGGEEYVGSGSDVRLDLTAGTVDGEPWDPLVWADGAEDDADVESGRTEYSIAYRNGDTVSGTYGFVVDTSDGIATTSPDEPLHAGPAGGSPYAVDAVYDVTVDVRHHTPDLRYEDRVRVAPGERDD